MLLPASTLLWSFSSSSLVLHESFSASKCVWLPGNFRTQDVVNFIADNRTHMARAKTTITSKWPSFLISERLPWDFVADPSRKCKAKQLDRLFHWTFASCPIERVGY